ncbi:MAG: tight adherence protein [Mycobacterium sp.]|nr:tight adherence protein [Mycobacterium sp.]
MSIAALALALALLVTPASGRRRIWARKQLAPRVSSYHVLAAAAVVALALSVLAPPGVVAATAIIGLTLEARRRHRRRRRARAAEESALQGALDVLVGELRVGAHPVAAFSVAARDVDGVVAEALRTIAARARLGADVGAGLRSVARRSSLPSQWERLAVCWRLAESHGLAIAALMQTAQRDLVERARFSARVDAGMAGARATAAVLACLPLVGIGLGQLIGADPLQFLLSGGVGGWLLVIGVALACAGLSWSDRITTRVLK